MLRSLLSGVDPCRAAADQWCLSPPHRHAFAARFEVNPHCRHDHRPWDVTSLAADAETLALGQALALAGDDRGNAPAAALSVDGQAFVRRTRCLRCGYVSRSRLRLSARAPTRACPACGAPLQVTGADVLDGLAVARVPKAWLDRCLGALGLEDRDLFTVTDGNGVAHHFELAAPDATA
jgi:hypothetical protein